MLKRYPLQILNYCIFMALVGYFSAAPAYRHLEEGQSKVVLAFSHAGQHLEPCRTVSPEELAKLSPNMRQATDCPRARSPVTVEVMMDGQPLFNMVVEPPGLFADGGVDVYTDTTVPAGEHQFAIKMNDSVRVEGYNYSHQQSAQLVNGQLLFIDFNTEDGFVFK